jgi:hypothetical protein
MPGKLYKQRSHGSVYKLTLCEGFEPQAGVLVSPLSIAYLP